MRTSYYTSTLACCFVVLFLCMGWAGSDAFSQNATLRGAVRDETGEPVIDARIEIPALKVGTLANADGIFSLSKLPAGKHTVTVSFMGMDTIRQEVNLEAGKQTTVNFTLTEKTTVLQTVEIEDRIAGKIDVQKINTAQVRISAKDINMLPTLGTPDLAQYLQVVPGVVFSGDQGGQLYIRGGTPIQNMVLMDGAIIYSPFHSIGLFSVFDTDYLRTVNVYTAGFPAEYGARASSVIDIRTRSGNFKKLSGKAHLNPITGGLLLEGPIVKPVGNSGGGASFLVSGRQSFIQNTSKSLFSYVNDGNGIPFAFSDLYGKVTLGSGANQLNAFAFRQTDDVLYDDPAKFGWKSNGGGVAFNFLPPGSGLIISGNFAYSKFDSEQRGTTDRFPRTSGISGFNGRVNFTHIFGGVDEMHYGIQLLGFKTLYDFTNALGISTKLEEDNSEAAVYLKYKKLFRRMKGDKAIDKWIIEPGIRTHFFNDKSHVAVEPRMSTKLNLPRVSFQATAGVYTQNLIAATSDREVVVLFQGFMAAPEQVAGQKFGNPLQHAFHAAGGMQLELLPHLETNIEVWYKDFSQLTNVNRLRLFNEDPIFLTETGKAYGIDLSLKYQKGDLYLYGTYGLAKNTRTDWVNNLTYAPVFDRRHNANIVAAWKRGELRHVFTNHYLESRWEFSARWTLGTGFPFTQTRGFFEKLDFNRGGSQTPYLTQNGSLGILLSPDYNMARLPAYHRLDISIKRRFLIAGTTVLELNVNAINVYNRANIFYVDRITGNRVNQLPFLPTVGAVFSF